MGDPLITFDVLVERVALAIFEAWASAEKAETTFDEVLAVGRDEGARARCPVAARFYEITFAEARAVIETIACAGLAIVPRACQPIILAAGWGAINAGRQQAVDMTPGPALREAWPEMVEAADLIPTREAA